MPTLESSKPTLASASEAWTHSEGPVAKAIENKTAQLPSDTFLWGAVTAMGVALVLQLSRKKSESLFIGQWVAPMLLFGVYNKLVKLGGSDRLQG